MTRKNIAMIASFILMAMMLSLSAFAAYADASGASAYVAVEEPADLLARARINSLLYYANDIDEGVQTVASASVSASDLTRVDKYPPTDSYATEWIGDTEIHFAYWPHD